MLPIIRSDFAVLEDPSRQSRQDDQECAARARRSGRPLRAARRARRLAGSDDGAFRRELIHGGTFSAGKTRTPCSAFWLAPSAAIAWPSDTRSAAPGPSHNACGTRKAEVVKLPVARNQGANGRRSLRVEARAALKSANLTRDARKAF
jgi:hypothetical protein